MRNKLLGLAIVGAAVAITFVACGEEDGGATTCSGDGDCQTGELCHPLAKVCVTSCTSGNDCPSESKNCDSLTVGGTVGADGGVTGGTASGKFCQCSTTALCGGGTDPNIICAKEDKICTTKCTSDGQCGTGRTCDTATGDCKTTASGTGGGSGGGGGGSCDWGSCSSTSGSAKMCGTGGCAAGATCTGSSQSTCAANSYCEGGACGWPTNPVTETCAAYTGTSANTVTWNPATSTGPVIYSITEVSHGAGEYDGGTACPATSSTCNGQCPFTATQWNIRVKAYRNDTAWPANRSGLSGFFYVNNAGSETDIIGASLLRPNVGYNAGTATNDKEFNLYHCSTSAAASFQPAYRFTGGNEACQQF